MRIAIVAPTLDILGGQGVQAAELADRLRADGHAVEFVPVNPAFPRGLRWLRRLPYARTVLNETLYIGVLARLRRARVVHVFSASYWSFLLAPVPAMLAGRLLRRRVVLHYHSGEAEDHLRRWGPLVHPWLRLCHEIVVPSRYLAEVFARHGYQTRVVPNLVDCARYRYRDRPTIAPRLLSVRNLEPYYRVDVVIRAFAAVAASQPGATLTVAGIGSQAAALRRLAASLGVASSVRFVGRVEPAAMPALFDAADVFVNASDVDNQPVSLLEAFAAGLPVVSTPTGDIAYMVEHGRTGLLVPHDHPGALAEAVVRLLQDPLLARALARQARRELEQYTWTDVRQLWRDVHAGDAAARMPPRLPAGADGEVPEARP